MLRAGAALFLGLYRFLRIIPYTFISISPSPAPVCVLNLAFILLICAPLAFILLSGCVLNRSVMLLLFNTSNYLGLFSVPKGLPAYTVLLLLPFIRFQPSGSGVTPLLRVVCVVLPLPVKLYSSDCDGIGI